MRPNNYPRRQRLSMTHVTGRHGLDFCMFFRRRPAAALARDRFQPCAEKDRAAPLSTPGTPSWKIREPLPRPRSTRCSRSRSVRARSRDAPPADEPDRRTAGLQAADDVAPAKPASQNPRHGRGFRHRHARRRHDPRHDQHRAGRLPGRRRHRRRAGQHAARQGRRAAEGRRQGSTVTDVGAISPVAPGLRSFLPRKARASAARAARAPVRCRSPARSCTRRRHRRD